MTQKCLGVVGGIPDLSGPIFKPFWKKIENLQKHTYYKIRIKIPIHFYFNFLLRYVVLICTNEGIAQHLSTKED